MNLPVPKTAVGKAGERAIVVAVVAGLGYLLKTPTIGEGSVLYFALKTILDVLNSNLPNA